MSPESRSVTDSTRGGVPPAEVTLLLDVMSTLVYDPGLMKMICSVFSSYPVLEVANSL